MTETVDLDDLGLLQRFGNERISLDGSYTKNDLAELIIEYSIPYYECHQCGWADHCPHVEWIDEEAGRARDIRCGVVSR